MTRTATKPTRVNLPAIARWVAEESVLFDDDSPFTADIADGDPRLVVITGGNADGKSLLFRVMAAKIHQAGATPVQLSIRERAGSGGHDMAGIRRIMMFGEESEQSTGATSVTSIRRAFEGNLDREAGSVLLLDEPELGLSEGYAVALGTYLGQQTKTIPAACSGVVVVTHSRPLVGTLVDAYGTRPTHVALGAPAGLDTWLTEPEVRTVEELLALADVGLERFRWAAARLRDR